MTRLNYQNILETETLEEIESLESLNARLEELDLSNRILFNETLDRYKKIESEIISLLKSSNTNEDRKTLIILKTTLSQRKKAFMNRFPDIMNAIELEKKEANLEVKAKDLFEKLDSTSQIPEDEANQFKIYWHSLTIDNKNNYLNKLKNALSQKKRDPVGVLTCFRGALFELSRREILERQGLERLEEYTEPIVVRYQGYKKLKKKDQDPISFPNFNNPPHKNLGGNPKGDIDIDINGIIKNGKPFVYETKNYPRKLYGSEYGAGESITARNQLLKYQQAIDSGLISGATVEINGRIENEFLVWTMGGKNIEDIGLIPDVEIIYNLPLPSGKDFRFILKRGSNGLKFENENENYSIQDKTIIRGLALALRDKSITKIFQDVNIATDLEHPLVTRDHIADPTTIEEDIDVFHAYHQMRTQNIWNNLKEKALNPNPFLKIASYSEEVNYEFIMRNLEKFQKMLDENPEFKVTQWAYVIEPHQYDEAVSKTMEEIAKIRSYEIDRDNSEEEKKRILIRKNNGYVGPEKGYPLDVDHVLEDVLQNLTKTAQDQKPRSYNDVSRFVSIEELQRKISSEDRSYVEIKFYDAQEDKYSKTIFNIEKHKKDEFLIRDLKMQKKNMLDNLRRAKTKLKNLLKRWAQLRQQENNDDFSQKDLSSVQRELSHYNHKGRKHLKKCQKELEDLEKEQDQSMAPLIAAAKTAQGEHKKELYQKLQRVSLDYREKRDANNKELMEIYKKYIFPKTWKNFTIQEVSRNKNVNFMKLIYVITADGNVILEEERIRGAEDSSRAAHSELAQGRNIYAAGELGLSKNKNGKWELTIINNGSGHYRPPQDTLIYAKEVISQKLGLSPEKKDKIILKNCIFRGVDIDGLPLTLVNEKYIKKY